MRNILKRSACLLLALCLCLSLTACYNEDSSWAAKSGDHVMPIGAYIYYLSSAYTEASDRVSANEKVLQGTIDGQNAKDWMKDRALAYVGAYYYLCDKYKELGLSLTDADLAAIDNGASAYWPYYKDRMEAIGISEDSFKIAYAEYNVRAQLMLEALYGEGGEKALSDDELWDYYSGNYDSYEYMYVSKSKTDDDNNSVAMTDQEKQDLVDTLNDFAGQINRGSITFSEAYTEYSYVSMTTPLHETPGAAKKGNIHSNISSALPDMKDNEVKVIEVETGCYLLQKLPLKDHFDTVLADKNSKGDLLTEIKGPEFREDLMEKGKAFLSSLEVNTQAVAKIKADSVVANKDETGGSVPPSAESGASSQAG